MKFLTKGASQLPSKADAAATDEALQAVSVSATILVPGWWSPSGHALDIKRLVNRLAGSGCLVDFQIETGSSPNRSRCAVCDWIHDATFTQMRAGGEAISLKGLLPDIVRTVHGAHEKGLAGMSTKDAQLAKICGGYYSPCKAFHGLKQQYEYRLLFDTSRRGTISLRGAIGKNWNKSESNLE